MLLFVVGLSACPAEECWTKDNGAWTHTGDVTDGGDATGGEATTGTATDAPGTSGSTVGPETSGNTGDETTTTGDDTTTTGDDTTTTGGETTSTTTVAETTTAAETTTGDTTGDTTGEGFCGNGVIDPGEACDGDDLGGLTCQLYSDLFSGGVLSCTALCHFNVGLCIPVNPATCGETLIEMWEVGCLPELAGLVDCDAKTEACWVIDPAA